MNPLSFLSKGLQGLKDIILIKSYEIPLDIEIDFEEYFINVEFEKEIIINIEKEE